MNLSEIELLTYLTFGLNNDQYFKSSLTIFILSCQPSPVVSLVDFFGTALTVPCGLAPFIFQFSLAFSALVPKTSLSQLPPILVENFDDIIEVLPFGILIRNFGLQGLDSNPLILVFDQIADIGLGAIKEIDAPVLAEFVRT